MTFLDSEIEPVKVVTATAGITEIERPR